MAVYTKVGGVTVTVKDRSRRVSRRDDARRRLYGWEEECVIKAATWQRSDGAAPAGAIEGGVMTIGDYHLKKQTDFDKAHEVINGFFNGMTAAQRADTQRGLAELETRNRLKHVLDTNLRNFSRRRRRGDVAGARSRS